MENEVFFHNHRGLKLAGIISRPSSSGKSAVVIMSHGFSSGKNSRTNRLLVPKLNALDIASLRFDFTGHYDSEGDIADVTISSGVSDLKSAMDFLSGEHWVDSSRLGFFGTSYGGAVVLWYVADFNKAKAIVLKSPVSDYAAVRELQLGQAGISEWKEKGFVLVEGGTVKTKYSFYEDAGSRDTYESAKSIRAQLLITHGDRDDNVPIEQSRALVRTLGDRARLQIIHGANHSYDRPGQLESVVDIATDFFKEKLA